MGTIAQIFESGEQSSNKGLFRNLVMLARIDGKVDDTELELLTRTAKRLSLTEEQVKEIKAHPENYPMVPPVSSEDRTERLIFFVELMIVDNKISEKELSLLEKYGIALGYTSEQITPKANQIIDLLGEGKTKNQILEILA